MGDNMLRFKRIVLCIVCVSITACSGPQSASSGGVGSSNGGGGGGPGGGNVTPPAAPTSLTATSPSASQITLNWADNSNNETSFRIDRAFASSGPFSSGMGPFTPLKEVGANVRTFTDNQLLPSTMYYYRVVALNGVVPSSASNQISATTQSAPSTPPSPPSNLSATSTAATVVTLSWSDGAINESYFQIERSVNGGATFAVIGTSSANVTTYQDINLSAQTSYMYRVRATNFAGNSNYSNNGSVTTIPAGNTNTYSYIAANIIGPNCVDCHGPSLQSAGYNFGSYAQFNGQRNAAMSAITGGRMPPGAPLTQAQINILNGWIAAGAPNN